MANPYQINDGESMASVRSKLNQMGNAVNGSATKEYVDNNLKKTTHIFDMPTEGTDISEHLNVLNNGGTIAYKSLDGKGNSQYYYVQDHFISGNYIVIFRAESSGNDIGEYKSIFYNESGVCTHIDGHMKEGLPAWGTTGQVLTKTDTGSEWKDSEGGMKVFTLSSFTDYTTATEAMNYVISGKPCAIKVPGMNLYYPSNATGIMWTSIRPNVNGGGGDTTLDDHGYYIDMMVFKVVSGSVTGIINESVGNKIVAESPSSPTTGVLYFITE